MPILKQQRAAPMLKEAIVLDMGDLRRQAEQLKQAARDQAERIIADAEQRAVSIAEQAGAEASSRGYEEGLAKGLEEGRQQGHAEALQQAAQQFAAIQQAWTKALQTWEQNRHDMATDARQTVLRVALLFAEKVVQRVIEVDPSVIADQLAEALQYVLRPTEVNVHIHPDDRPALDETLPAVLNEFENVTQVHLVHDEKLTRGGCTISYGQGRIDATVDTQFRRIAAMLLPDGTPPAASGLPGMPATGVADDADDNNTTNTETTDQT